jgi:hypothetical protein
MRKPGSIIIAILAVAMICIVAGCAGSGGNSMKERGVYTTLAVEGRPLDMPGSQYTSYKTFAPDQKPAAVVVGYGYWDGTYDHPQPFNLQLVESNSSAAILDLNGNAYADKAAIFELPIRTSGNYQLKLIINNSVYDTWDFTVNREASAQGAKLDGQKPVYAKGIFDFGMVSDAKDAEFADYDNYFLRALNDAMRRASNNANPSLFSQVTPGKAVISFQLDENGNVSNPKITESSLDDGLCQFLIHGLESGAPYKSWSDGTHSRVMKVTFNYE